MSERAPSEGVRLFREAGLYTAGMMVMRVGNFLLLPLYTAVLTQAEFGAVGVLEPLTGLLVILAMAGQGDAMLRLGADRERDPAALGRLQSSTFTWALSAGVVLTLLLAAAWPWLEPAGVPLWPTGAAALSVVVGTVGFRLVQSWLQFRRQVVEHIRATLVRWGLEVAAILTLLGLFGLRAEALLLGAGLSFAGGAVLASRSMRERPRLAVHGPTLRGSLSYGVPLVPHLVAVLAFHAGDRLVLGALTDLATVGVYTLSAKLAMTVLMVAQGMQKAWVPFFFAEDRDREERGWLRVRRLSFFSLVVVATTAVAVGLLAPEIVFLAGRAAYAEAAGIVPVLVMGKLLWAYYAVAATVVLAELRTARLIGAVTVPAALLNLGLNVLWVPQHGARGAAFATLVAYGVALVLAASLSRAARKVPFKVGRGLALLVLVGGTLALGDGRGLGVRLGLLLAFGVAVVVLDHRDLRASFAALRARRAGARV